MGAVSRRVRLGVMSVLVVGLGLSAAVGLALAAGAGALSAPGVASGPVAGAAQAPSAEEGSRTSSSHLPRPKWRGAARGQRVGTARPATLPIDWRRAGSDPGATLARSSRGFLSVAPRGRRAGSALERVALSPGPLALGRDWAPHGGSLEGDAAGEVVFVGYGLDGGPGDYAGVSGKIALALDGGATRARRRPGSRSSSRRGDTARPRS